MQSASLAFKVALALASIIAYLVLAQLFERMDNTDTLPHVGLWFNHTVAAVFGALVLAPYLGARQRIFRFVAICAASAVIYYLAFKFVADGPFGYDAITSFILAGAGAALLSGLTVVLIAPRAFDWRLVALTLLAGALGGAAFELKFPSDEYLLFGHGTWQILVCLALHFGLRNSPT